MKFPFEDSSLWNCWCNLSRSFLRVWHKKSGGKTGRKKIRDFVAFRTQQGEKINFQKVLSNSRLDRRLNPLKMQNCNPEFQNMKTHGKIKLELKNQLLKYFHFVNLTLITAQRRSRPFSKAVYIFLFAF